MGPSFQYAATVVKIVDGDTIDATIDLGFRISVEVPLRLLGLNAAEHGTASGDAATAWLAAQLPAGADVVVVTERDRHEKYGRYLATVWLGSRNINAELIASGHAAAWDGHGPRPTP